MKLKQRKKTGIKTEPKAEPKDRSGKVKAEREEKKECLRQ